MEKGELKSFCCVLCGNKLASKELLQEHFRKHANKEIDNKGRPVMKQINKIKDNDNVLNFSNDFQVRDKIECDVCKMNFQTVTQAIQHKFRKHPESSSKYYCPFCGMQFPLKFTRDKHVQNHQGMSTVGSFPCSECNVTFHNSTAQQYHVRSVHKRIASLFKPIPTPPPSKKIKINSANEVHSVYYCYLCGSEYVIKFNLQKHLERAHSEEERNMVPKDLIKCTTCDALFYNKRAYDTHNMYHRPDDLYVTSEEQRLQTVTRVDQDFDIRRVQLTADKFIPLDKPKRPPKKIEIKMNEKPFKSDLDDELSPTSSIDSTDSEENEEKPDSKFLQTNLSQPENVPNSIEIQKKSNLIKTELDENKLISENNPNFYNKDQEKLEYPDASKNSDVNFKIGNLGVDTEAEPTEKLLETNLDTPISLNTENISVDQNSEKRVKKVGRKRKTNLGLQNIKKSKNDPKNVQNLEKPVDSQEINDIPKNQQVLKSDKISANENFDTDNLRGSSHKISCRKTPQKQISRICKMESRAIDDNPLISKTKELPLDAPDVKKRLKNKKTRNSNAPLETNENVKEKHLNSTKSSVRRKKNVFETSEVEVTNERRSPRTKNKNQEKIVVNKTRKSVRVLNGENLIKISPKSKSIKKVIPKIPDGKISRRTRSQNKKSPVLKRNKITNPKSKTKRRS